MKITARRRAGSCETAVFSAVVCDEAVFGTLTGPSGAVRVRDEVRADAALEELARGRNPGCG